jgi:hypothetical protein
MSTLFPTINASHWASMFAAYRRQGAFEGQAMLAQIRAALRRETLVSPVQVVGLKEENREDRSLEMSGFVGIHASSDNNPSRCSDGTISASDAAQGVEAGALSEAGASGSCSATFHNREPSVTIKANERDVSACENRDVNARDVGQSFRSAALLPNSSLLRSSESYADAKNGMAGSALTLPIRRGI